LVYLQLENFNKKVRLVYSGQVTSFSKLNWYDIVILSTVVEKEERNRSNKSTVA
jgi:cell division protein YceG involved in septum cleavage